MRQGRQGGRLTRRLSVVSAGLSVALVAAACGSSHSASSSSTQSAGSSTGTQTSAPSASTNGPAYNGPEASLPTAYPAPHLVAHSHFVVGFLNPSAGDQSLDIEQAAVQAEAKALGGTSIAYNIMTNPQVQVARFNDLLAQGVNAIILEPQNPLALTPEIKKAAAKGVPLITNDTPADPAAPLLPGYLTNTLRGDDQCAYANAQALAKTKPGASYVLMPSGLPYPALQYLSTREKYWAGRFGLKYLGEVNTGTGFLPPDGSKAMATIEAQYPTADAVMTWVDTVAEGAATTARATHKHILITGSGGETAALAMVKQGSLFATCAYNWADFGKQEAIAAYEAATDPHQKLPAKIVIPVQEVTHDGSFSVLKTSG
jgi:ABC-type sugar transport system substrate-binding protein